MDEFGTHLIDYLSNYGKESMVKLVNFWNIWQEKAQKNELIYDEREILQQYKEMKGRLWQMTKGKQFFKLYEENKRKFKEQQGLNINMHNEVCRNMLASGKMYSGMQDTLVIYTRSECMWAAEAKCEGEVKKANYRLRNRYKLKAEMFGWEHVSQELYLLFKNRMTRIYRNCVERYKQKYKKNTLRNPATKSKYIWSATIDKLVKQEKLRNIDDSRIEFQDVTETIKQISV